MFYAKLTSLGGHLVEASQADYRDYKGFLRCPECGEPVFLRKAHQRGKTQIPDAFVHHRAVEAVSVCELRVGRYTSAEVEASRSAARSQRLRTLTISLWKFLKRNLAVSLKSWSQWVRHMESGQFLREIVKYAEEILKSNISFIVTDTFNRVSALLVSQDPRIVVSPEMDAMTKKFLTSRARDWPLHCQIAREALELFLSSGAMAEIRHRLCCCLSHPETLRTFPDLLDLDTATQEWRGKFVSYLTLEVVFVFLTVDWIAVFRE